MDQWGDELKKVLKAGMGAVATGVEKTQEAIESLAKKGEPLYQQAKSAVVDAADKVKQAVSDGIQSMSPAPQVQEIIDILRGMTQADWDQVRAALDEFEAQAKDSAQQEAAQAAEDILNQAEKDAEAQKAEDSTEDSQEGPEA